MHLIVLSLLLPFFGRPIAPGPPVTLREAMQQGLIEVEVSGAGGHTGESLRLKVGNRHVRALELRIPAGQYFPSEDSTLQDLMVIQSEAVVLTKGESRTLKLRGMCTQADHGSPGEGSLFRVGAPAGGQLGQLAAYLDRQRITDMSAQYAIWAVTNGESLGNITNEELRRFTAELLGKTPPPYAILRNDRPAAPRQPAFSQPPLAVQGVFTYQTDTDILASFGLYNEAGELIHAFFTDQPQRKGGHRFKFSFEIRNAPSGTYFARMRSGEQTIGELRVEW